MEVDSEFQTNLMDSKSIYLCSTDGENEEKNTEITILKNYADSKACTPTIDFCRNKLSTNHAKNERNLWKKLSLTKLDMNSYIDVDTKYFDCDFQGIDPISLLFESELTDLESEANNSMDLKDSDVDSEHYLCHDLSNTSQLSSVSSSLTCNPIALSDLSQTDSKTRGYVQNNLTSSGLELINLDSNGYIKNSTESFDSNQTDLQSHVYVQNGRNSCSTIQVDPEIGDLLKKKYDTS